MKKDEKIALQMKLSGKKAHELSSKEKKLGRFFLHSFKVGRSRRKEIEKVFRFLTLLKPSWPKLGGKLIRIESSFVLFIIIIRTAPTRELVWYMARGNELPGNFRNSTSS